MIGKRESFLSIGHVVRALLVIHTYPFADRQGFKISRVEDNTKIL